MNRICLLNLPTYSVEVLVDSPTTKTGRLFVLILQIKLIEEEIVSILVLICYFETIFLMIHTIIDVKVR